MVVAIVILLAVAALAFNWLTRSGESESAATSSGLSKSNGTTTAPQTVQDSPASSTFRLTAIRILDTGTVFDCLTEIGCNGQFTVKNTTKTPADISGSMFVLASDGNVYQSDASADFMGISVDHLDGSLNPGESAIINVAFALPSDVRVNRFFIADSADSNPLAQITLNEKITFHG